MDRENFERNLDINITVASAYAPCDLYINSLDANFLIKTLSMYPGAIKVDKDGKLIQYKGITTIVDDTIYPYYLKLKPIPEGVIYYVR